MLLLLRAAGALLIRLRCRSFRPGPWHGVAAVLMIDATLLSHHDRAVVIPLRGENAF